MAIEAIKSWKGYFSKEYSKILELFYGQEYSLYVQSVIFNQAHINR